MGLLPLRVLRASVVNQFLLAPFLVAPTAIAGAEPIYETVVHGDEPEGEDARGRAASRVDRRDIQERQPRSAPDALRYEPGVFVQQTAHGQGSAFVRGRTGQQTVMLFDGIRLNNSTFRQGPNQYFFTLDASTIRAIDVVRGSASVRHGSDAIGGAIEALPIEAPLWPDIDGFRASPRSVLRLSSADDMVGQRFQLDWQWDRLGFVGGAGFRSVGLLESGGPVLGPATGRPAAAPRFADDGRTQLGTGFDELTFDARSEYDLGEGRRVVAALYGYRQYDAPRTDQCPPRLAPHDECLEYDEQFRTLAYAGFRGPVDGTIAADLRASVSYQRQHELRSLRRPASHTLGLGADNVDTYGVAARARSGTLRLAPGLDLAIRYGGDVYHDRVESAAWLTFTDVDVTRRLSRGQYLDGATYTWGGFWVEPEIVVADDLTISAGARLGASAARAPGEPQSESAPVDATWFAPAARAGLGWVVADRLVLHVNVDQAYRTPNLDDLTSRQQTGPGFQFENAELRPEEALTVETGAEWGLARVTAEAWAYWTPMWGAIARAPREASECPAGAEACRGSWNRFQLVNLPGRADVFGVEFSMLAALPAGFALRQTLAWAWGEGPNPAGRPADPRVPYRESLPLSRIPPLNGTFELMWRADWGLWAGAAMRWAAGQDRLALQDLSDARIPEGGTPGFAVLDLRLGYRLRRHLVVGLVIENLADAAYRHHGSGVNGPARGASLTLEAAL